MKATVLALLALTLPTITLAETHEVHMLNRGESGPMVYEPPYLKIEPGDTVRFLPTQPSHNAATIDDMIPEGAEPFKSQINEVLEVTFDQAGSYGIKCSPHYAMGMVMLIEVGETDLPVYPENVPARARERFERIVADHRDGG